MSGKNEKRILILEDDENFGRQMYELLDQSDYYVIWQKSAEGASQWTTAGTFWDMIISDQRMPGELGAVFLKFMSELEKKNIDQLDKNSNLYKYVREIFSDLSDAQFLEHLQGLKSHPTIRVILSGYAEDDSIEKGLKDGIIHRYLKKSLDPLEILSEIRQLFDNHAPSNSA